MQNWSLPEDNLKHSRIIILYTKIVDVTRAWVWLCIWVFLIKVTRKNSMTPRWQGRRICTHLLLWELQNYSSLLNNRQQENVGLHQKKIPQVQGQRRCPSKMVGGVKLCLESNPLFARDTRRAQTNLVCARTQRPRRDWARTEFECLLWNYRLAVDCCRGRGSGCHRPGYCISPLGGDHH